MPRRGLTYLFIVIGIVIVAALLYRNFPNQSAKDADEGQLIQAVDNFKTHSSDKAHTISDDTNHQADIQSDGQSVIWYNQNTERFHTYISSPDDITPAFRSAG